MKNRILNDFLDNLRVEAKTVSEASEADLKDYLDSNPQDDYIDDEEESLENFLRTKQSGKVFRTDIKHTRGKTGSNIYYDIDFPALKNVLEKITKKNFTLVQVESIVSAVRLAMGVGTEEEKKAFKK